MKNYLKPEVEYIDFATEEITTTGVTSGGDEDLPEE